MRNITLVHAVRERKVAWMGSEAAVSTREMAMSRAMMVLRRWQYGHSDGNLIVATLSAREVETKEALTRHCFNQLIKRRAPAILEAHVSVGLGIGFAAVHDGGGVFCARAMRRKCQNAGALRHIAGGGNGPIAFAQGVGPDKPMRRGHF